MSTVYGYYLRIKSKKAEEDSKYAHRSGIQFLSLVYHLQSPKYMARIKGKICYFAVKRFCKQGEKHVGYIQREYLKISYFQNYFLMPSISSKKGMKTSQT